MFEIVKREHIRQPSLLVSATSSGVTAPLDRVCSASKRLRRDPKTGLSDDVRRCRPSRAGAADIDHESDQVP